MHNSFNALVVANTVDEPSPMSVFNPEPVTTENSPPLNVGGEYAKHGQPIQPVQPVHPAVPVGDRQPQQEQHKFVTHAELDTKWNALETKLTTAWRTDLKAIEDRLTAVIQQKR